LVVAQGKPPGFPGYFTGKIQVWLQVGHRLVTPLA
jgi:hypothetical protein